MAVFGKYSIILLTACIVVFISKNVEEVNGAAEERTLVDRDPLDPDDTNYNGDLGLHAQDRSEPGQKSARDEGKRSKADDSYVLFIQMHPYFLFNSTANGVFSVEFVWQSQNLEYTTLAYSGSLPLSTLTITEKGVLKHLPSDATVISVKVTRSHPGDGKWFPYYFFFATNMYGTYICNFIDQFDGDFACDLPHCVVSIPVGVTTIPCLPINKQ